jgi:hypothetical protein
MLDEDRANAATTGGLGADYHCHGIRIIQCIAGRPRKQRRAEVGDAAATAAAVVASS